MRGAIPLPIEMGRLLVKVIMITTSVTAGMILLPAVISEVLLSIVTWLIDFLLSLVLQAVSMLLSIAINALYTFLSGDLLKTVQNSSIGTLITSDLYEAFRSIGIVIIAFIVLFQLQNIIKDEDGRNSESVTGLCMGAITAIGVTWFCGKPVFYDMVFKPVFIGSDSVWHHFSTLITGAFEVDANVRDVFDHLTVFGVKSDTFFGGLTGATGAAATVLSNLAGIVTQALFIVILGFVLKFLAQRCITLALSILNRMVLTYVLILVFPLTSASLASKNTRQSFSGWLKLFLGNMVSLFFSLFFVQIIFNVLISAITKAGTPDAGDFVAGLIEVFAALVVVEMVISIEAYVQQMALGGVSSMGSMYMMTMGLMRQFKEGSAWSAMKDAVSDRVSGLGDMAGSVKNVAASGGDTFGAIGRGISDNISGTKDAIAGSLGFEQDKSVDGTKKKLDEEGRSTPADEKEKNETGKASETGDAQDGTGTAAEDGNAAENGAGLETDADGNPKRYDADGKENPDGAYYKDAATGGLVDAEAYDAVKTSADPTGRNTDAGKAAENEPMRFDKDGSINPDGDYYRDEKSGELISAKDYEKAASAACLADKKVETGEDGSLKRFDENGEVNPDGGYYKDAATGNLISAKDYDAAKTSAELAGRTPETSGGTPKHFDENGRENPDGAYYKDAATGQLFHADAYTKAKASADMVGKTLEGTSGEPADLAYTGNGMYAKDAGGTYRASDASDTHKDADGNDVQNRYNRDGMPDDNGSLVRAADGGYLDADSMKRVDRPETPKPAETLGEQAGRLITASDGSHYVPDAKGVYGDSDCTTEPVRIPQEALNADGSIRDDVKVDANGRQTGTAEDHYVATGRVMPDDETGTLAPNAQTGEMETISPQAFDEDGNIKPEARFGENSEYVRSENGNALNIGPNGDNRYREELANVAGNHRFTPASPDIPASRMVTGDAGVQAAMSAANANNSAKGNMNFTPSQTGAYAYGTDGRIHAIDPQALCADGSIRQPAIVAENGSRDNNVPGNNHFVQSAGSGVMLDIGKGRYDSVAGSNLASEGTVVPSDTGHMLPDANGVAHPIRGSVGRDGAIRGNARRYDATGNSDRNGAFIRADDGALVEAYVRSANGVKIPASEKLDANGKTMESSAAGRGYSVESSPVGADGGRCNVVAGSGTAMDNAKGYAGYYNVCEAFGAAGTDAVAAKGADGQMHLVPKSDFSGTAMHDGRLKNKVPESAVRSRPDGSSYFISFGGHEIACSKEGFVAAATQAFEEAKGCDGKRAAYADNVSGVAADVSGVMKNDGSNAVRDDAQFMFQTVKNGNTAFVPCERGRATHVSVPTADGSTVVPCVQGTDASGQAAAVVDAYHVAQGSGVAMEASRNAAEAAPGYMVRNTRTGERGRVQTAPVADPAHNCAYNPQTATYTTNISDAENVNVNTGNTANLNSGRYTGTLSKVRAHRNKESADKGYYSAMSTDLYGNNHKVNLVDAKSPAMQDIFDECRNGRQKVFGFVPDKDGGLGYWVVSAEGTRQGSRNQKR